MGPKNRATNWPYNRFGTISDGTITGMHCIQKRKMLGRISDKNQFY